MFRKPVTFDEFVRFVMWEIDRGRINRHWKPQYDLCAPCYVNYDYYCYYETIQQDARYILDRIAAGSNVTFPLGELGRREPNSQKYLRLFDEVPVSRIGRILDLYRNDYSVFGYKIPDRIQRRLSQAAR